MDTDWFALVDLKCQGDAGLICHTASIELNGPWAPAVEDVFPCKRVPCILEFVSDDGGTYMQVWQGPYRGGSSAGPHFVDKLGGDLLKMCLLDVVKLVDLYVWHPS